jgi:hypothetical protein
MAEILRYRPTLVHTKPERFVNLRLALYWETLRRMNTVFWLRRYLTGGKLKEWKDMNTTLKAADLENLTGIRWLNTVLNCGHSKCVHSY